MAGLAETYHVLYLERRTFRSTELSDGRQAINSTRVRICKRTVIEASLESVQRKIKTLLTNKSVPILSILTVGFGSNSAYEICTLVLSNIREFCENKRKECSYFLVSLYEITIMPVQ